MNAAPVFCGIPRKKFWRAGMPPADAPIATITGALSVPLSRPSSATLLFWPGIAFSSGHARLHNLTRFALSENSSLNRPGFDPPVHSNGLYNSLGKRNGLAEHQRP